MAELRAVAALMPRSARSEAGIVSRSPVKTQIKM
jgi:hypothetical protein